MSIPVRSDQDYLNISRIINHPPSVANGQVVVHEQLLSAIEGLAHKDSARVATQANINLAAPGATIDGITMVSGDRVLVRSQTAPAENGIYIFNGAATPMTRAPDASTFDELEAATLSVEEGTSVNLSYRQSAINGTLGTTGVTFAPFGTGAPAASETQAGVVELATAAETTAGVSNSLAVTPASLAGSVFANKTFAATIGDGTATSYAVTHNFNTRDVQVQAWETSGLFREVFVQKQLTSVNAVTIVFSSAPAAGAIRIVVKA